MTAYCGFGASPFRYHGSLGARAHSPLIPFHIAHHVHDTAPGSRPVRLTVDVGPEGHPLFRPRVFLACTAPASSGVHGVHSARE